MNAFLLKEWWRYWWAAKGRHGVHSPFVYRFIEEGLGAALPEEVAQALRATAPLRAKYEAAACIFRCMEFLKFTEGTECCLIATEDAEERFYQHAGQLSEGVAIIITDIHKDAQRAALWVRLCADARVNLSIDLWHIGLLFYHPDFKERQLFVLKYRP